MTTSAERRGVVRGHLALHNITDPGPSLAFRVEVPVVFEGIAATLSAEVRSSNARGWRSLAGRVFSQDPANPRTEKSDGAESPLDLLLGDLRAADRLWDVRVSRLAFGEAKEQWLGVEIEAEVLTGDAWTPLVVNMLVEPGVIWGDAGYLSILEDHVEVHDYTPPTLESGRFVLAPR